MPTSTDLLLIGSFVVGITVRLPRQPVLGETLVADLFDLGVGGKGANLAVAAARQGVHVSICARVGDDAFAQMAADLFTREGIDYSGIQRTPGEKTAVGLIYLMPNGENMIGFYRGANWHLTPADVTAHFARHPEAQLVATQFETPDDALMAVVQEARMRGLPVLLNPAPARPVSPDLLAGVDILTPNETEVRLLMGLRPDDESVGAVELARGLLAQGPDSVIVTLGANGCLLVQHDADPLYVPAHPVTPVDTVGAGDAFNGGLAAALLAGMTLPDAVRWANATAALSTRAVGAVDGLPTRGEVSHFIQATG